MDLPTFKQSCTDYMFWCFGTSAIFQRREARLKIRRLWITYLGIIGPVVLGSVVASFGADLKILPVAITVAGIVGIVQLVFSVWALAARWDENYSAAQDSMRGNTSLYNRFKSIRDMPPPDYVQAFVEAKAEYERQEAIDIRQTISAKEKSYANHEALRYTGKPCSVCRVTPTTAKPSKCDSCGNY